MRCGYASDSVPTVLLSPMSCRVTCGPAHGASYPSRWRHEASKPSFNRADGEGDTADAPAGWDAAALDCTAAIVTGRRQSADLNMETMTSSMHHIVEAKVGGGTVGQVRDDQAIGLAAVLVHHHDVRHPVTPTHLHQLWQHLQPWDIILMNHTHDFQRRVQEIQEAGCCRSVPQRPGRTVVASKAGTSSESCLETCLPAAVHPLGVGEYQLQLLRELHQPRAGVA